jgi:hypothetical protein
MPMTLVFVPHYFSHQRERQQYVKSKQKKYRDDDPCVSFSSFWSPLLDAVVVVEVVEIVFFDAAFPIFFFYFFFFFSCDEDDDERVVSR